MRKGLQAILDDDRAKIGKLIFADASLVSGRVSEARVYAVGFES